MFAYSWLPNGVPVQVVAQNNSTDQQQQQHQITSQGGQVIYQNVQPNTTHSAVGESNSMTITNSNNSNMIITPANDQRVTPYQSSSHKKKRIVKVNKDGIPQPKRATTPYINFTQWYRENLKGKGVTIPKISEFGKECAVKWHSMSEEDKKPFVDVSEKDRDRYRKEMAVYKPAREAGKPKRPGTAFMLFMNDFRKEMAGKEPEGGVSALAKLGGERWRGMSEDDKRPYVELQNVERIRYEAAIEEYRRTTGNFGPGIVIPPPHVVTVSASGEVLSRSEADNIPDPSRNKSSSSAGKSSKSASPSGSQEHHDENSSDEQQETITSENIISGETLMSNYSQQHSFQQEFGNESREVKYSQSTNDSNQESYMQDGGTFDGGQLRQG